MDANSFIPQIEPWITDDELSEITAVIKSTFITENTKTEEFEELFRKYTGAKHVIAYSNGSMALFGALYALGIGQGNEVIVPDLTFVASPNAVILAGAKPVFCDVDPKTLQTTRALIEAKITPATKAIMPVHLYGNAVAMDEIMDLAREKGLVVFEDGAEAVGTKYKGKHVSTIGDIGILSFYGNKTMTTAEGGLILTDSDELAEKSIRFKNCGRLTKGTFIHDEIGHNFRITDLHSAIGVAQFKKLPEILKLKMHIYETYKSLMPNVKFYGPSDGVEMTPWFTNIRVEDPEALSEHLRAKNIGTRRLFYPMHKQPCYQGLDYFEGEFPGSLDAYEHGLSLPSSVTLTGDQLKYITDSINDFLEG